MGTFGRSAQEQGLTNPRPASRICVEADCCYKWSALQEQTYKRVSTPGRTLDNGAQSHTIILDNLRRAKRIAATYARIYLESEDVQGDKAKKGRYYWPALGAFAVKQVYCGFKFADEALVMKLVGWLPAFKKDNALLLEAMSRGNFWLFQELAPWHLFYTHWPDDFDECIEERDEQQFHETVRKNLKTFPWNSQESIAKLDHFRVTADLRRGLKLFKKIEEADEIGRPQLQYDSLVFLAKHEQNVVLQRLTYADAEVQRILKMQATTETMVPGMMERAVFFAAACELHETEPNRALKVRMGYTQDGEHEESRDMLGRDPEADAFGLAPRPTRFGRELKAEKALFDASQRWLFVTRVADAFHRLMQKRTTYMEDQIAAIASWSNA